MAQSIANQFISGIQGVLSAASFSVPAPTVEPPRNLTGFTGTSTGAGAAPPTSVKTVNIGPFYNPTVQSADRDTQKALVYDRLAGST